MARFLASLRRAPRRRPILGDRRGAVIVEFALVAFPFCALLFAILQASLAYLAQETLESAVEVAARTIVTGQTQAADVQSLTQGLTRQQLAERFRRKGCESLPSFMSCSRLYVDVRSLSQGAPQSSDVLDLAFDALGKPTSNFAYDLGGQGSIVMVRFVYLWPMRVTPIGDAHGAPAGQTMLMATSVSKSEVYI